MIPVLRYLAVTDAPAYRERPWTVSPAAFATQVRMLAGAGRTPLTVSRFVEARRAGTLPAAPLVLTFDGGGAGIGDAVRLAADLGVASTVYLPTGRLDRPGMLRRADVTRMHALGTEIGGAGHTYRRLGELPPADQRAEIERGRDELADLLGTPPVTFAYPHGDHDAGARAAVAAAGFRSACAGERRHGRATAQDNRHGPATAQDNATQNESRDAAGALDVFAIPRHPVRAGISDEALLDWLDGIERQRPGLDRLRAAAVRLGRLGRPVRDAAGGRPVGAHPTPGHGAEPVPGHAPAQVPGRAPSQTPGRSRTPGQVPGQVPGRGTPVGPLGDFARDGRRVTTIHLPDQEPAARAESLAPSSAGKPVPADGPEAAGGAKAGRNAETGKDDLPVRIPRRSGHAPRAHAIGGDRNDGD